MKNGVVVLISTLLVIVCFSANGSAQTTEITYQGQLQSSSAAANGNFDFEFLLFDALSGGAQIGATIMQNGVAVANGIFSVNLDFGSSFPGAARFLEVHVRPAGIGAFTSLTPRQPVTSTPYSLKSLNAVAATTAASAATATNFSGNLTGDVNGTQSTTTVNRLRGRDVAGTAPINGQVLKFNGTTNQWEPDTDNTVAGGGGGTITGVTPGTGLSGGGATGNVTLNIANGGVGTAQLADNNVTDAKINSVSGSKVTGVVANATNAVNATNATTAVTATTATSALNATNAVNAATAVNFTGSLAGDVSGTQGVTSVSRLQGRNVSNTAPSNGQVLKFNTAINQWLPDTDNAGAGTITGVTPGTGLSGGGATGSVALSIANGGVSTAQLDDNSVTDAKIIGVSGAKVTGPVASATTATNASQLGGVAAAQYVVTTDPRMTDARTPLANSSNYIQNSTSTQASSNFKISGSGTASTFNVTNEYQIGGSRVLGVQGTENVFVGVGAGGTSTGASNSFFGSSAGLLSTTGGTNSFFGTLAGRGNVTGSNNSYFGASAGRANQGGTGNSFFGVNAGTGLPLGFNNTFLGSNAGTTLINGQSVGNTFVGSEIEAPSGLVNATAIGYQAFVSSSNSLVLGSVINSNGATSDTNVGIGLTNPNAKLHIRANGGQILQGDGGCSTGVASIGFSPILTCSNYALSGSTANTFLNRPSGGGIHFRENNVEQMRIDAGGNVGIGTSSPNDKLDVEGAIRVSTLGTGGATSLCRNNSNQLSSCSSSARYKSNIATFHSGLVLVKQLRPVSFSWNDGGMLDMGLVAEEVAAIEPLLITTNTKGQAEGVKYDRVGVVLVNAVKEQQTQIESQQRQIDEQKETMMHQQSEIAKYQKELEMLKKLVCSTNATAEICQKQERPR